MPLKALTPLKKNLVRRNIKKKKKNAPWKRFLKSLQGMVAYAYNPALWESKDHLNPGI